MISRRVLVSEEVRSESNIPVGEVEGVVKLAHLLQHFSLASALEQSASFRLKHSASLQIRRSISIAIYTQASEE